MTDISILSRQDYVPRRLDSNTQLLYMRKVALLKLFSIDMAVNINDIMLHIPP